jgi:pimeloyl-ACP methyl ester carboxylesterase
MRLAPSARVEVWEGSGHMLHLADPERFAARVRPLLEDRASNQA